MRPIQSSSSPGPSPSQFFARDPHKSSRSTTAPFYERTDIEQRVDLGIDLGTGNTVVAKRYRGNVEVLCEFKDDPHTNSQKMYVPTDICYPLTTNTSSRSTRNPNSLYQLLENCAPYIGWGVSKAIRDVDSEIHQWEQGRIKNLKSILESPRGENLQGKRQETAALDSKIRQLIHVGAIVRNTDVLRTYLVDLLNDVYGILENEKKVPLQDVHFAFSYPLTWTVKSRGLYEKVIHEALKQSKFNWNEGDSIFMLHEAEAAMNTVLQRKNLPDGFTIQDGTKIGILDAGAGTKDAAVYQLCLPEGIHIGGNDLNIIVDSELKRQLSSRSELEKRAADHRRNMVMFEDELKGFIASHGVPLGWHVDGGKWLTISCQDQERLFVEPVFAPIRDLVVKLTSNVRALGDGDFDYWFLTGAFTNCKWLRKTIEEGLEQMSPPFGNRRVLRSKNTQQGCSDVAEGLVERLSKPGEDPIHFFLASVGVIREHITKDPRDPRALLNRPTRGKWDSYLRVETVAWKINKGETDKEPFQWVSEHMWLLSDVTPISDEPILAAELIVVSDEHHEPTDDENEQLSKDHSKNEGTEHYGTAVFDVSVLFKDNRLELIVPSATDKLGKPHYCTSFDIEARFNGFNLEIGARWPAGGIQGRWKHEFKGTIPMASLFPSGSRK